MNDREPDAPLGYRRPLPGPHDEQGVQDALANHAADEYNFARQQAREAAARLREAVDDDGEHGASATIQRWEDERMAGIE